MSHGITVTNEHIHILAYTFSAQSVLQSFGRGNYVLGTPRNNDDTIQNNLLLLNSFETNFWLDEFNFSPTVMGLKTALDRGQLTKPLLVDRLFLDVLFRAPTEQEKRVITTHIQNLPSERAVGDALWLVLNHPDFLYY